MFNATHSLCKSLEFYKNKISGSLIPDRLCLAYVRSCYESSILFVQYDVSSYIPIPLTRCAYLSYSLYRKHDVLGDPFGNITRSLRYKSTKLPSYGRIRCWSGYTPTCFLIFYNTLREYSWSCQILFFFCPSPDGCLDYDHWSLSKTARLPEVWYTQVAIG